MDDYRFEAMLKGPLEKNWVPLRDNPPPRCKEILHPKRLLKRAFLAMRKLIEASHSDRKCTCANPTSEHKMHKMCWLSTQGRQPLKVNWRTRRIHDATRLQATAPSTPPSRIRIHLGKAHIAAD